MGEVELIYEPMPGPNGSCQVVVKTRSGKILYTAMGASPAAAMAEAQGWGLNELARVTDAVDKRGTL